MTARYEPLVCPRCGNTTEQAGITHCYLEWRIAPVAGVCGDKVVVDWGEQEGADIDPTVRVTMTNTPNAAEDLEHFFCNACDWRWYDGREQDEGRCQLPPPHIFDADAFRRMAEVEGEAWGRQQLADEASPFGFFAHLAAWRAIEKEGMVGQATTHEALGMGLVPGVKGRGDGAIYGEGGYSRYYVRRDGSIHLDYGSTHTAKQERAQALGFPPG